MDLPSWWFMTQLSVNKFLKHMFLEGNIHTEIWVKFEVTFVEIIQPSIIRLALKKYKFKQLCLFKIWPVLSSEARCNIKLIRQFKSYDFLILNYSTLFWSLYWRYTFTMYCTVFSKIKEFQKLLFNDPNYCCKQ